jgi:hypothetical protein
MTTDQLGFSALEQAKLAMEQLLKEKLEETYNSREDDNEDEAFGHYINFEYVIDGCVSPSMEPLILQIYEDGKVQLFYDATPYPVSANTKEEARTMAQTLCHAPVPFDKITEEDFSNTVETIKMNY